MIAFSPQEDVYKVPSPLRHVDIAPTITAYTVPNINIKNTPLGELGMPG